MQIDRLYITAQSTDYPQTREVAETIGDPNPLVEKSENIYKWIRRQPDPVSMGKKALVLTTNKGAFLKKCPGTSYYTCCDYQILHLASYCSMDCAYCILQVYFHPPILQYFVNQEDMFAELEHKKDRLESRRIGTGEFTDSLIWEPWSDISTRLVNYFAAQDRLVLELKTKTTDISKLRHLDHNRKTIMAWSLNTPKVIRELERGTASLKSRLQAARTCQNWGYPLAFHFDPIIIYPGWQEDYKAVIDILFSQVDHRNIVWISMGTFRYIPALKGIIQRRFPKANFIYGEFFPGLDGKMRYLRPLRQEVYAAMARWIRGYAPDLALYLCMEDDIIWQNSLGADPGKYGGLPAMLDQAAVKVCDLV